MEQRKRPSVQVIAGAAILAAIGAGFVVVGLRADVEGRWRSWEWKLIALLLGFSAGFLLIEIAARYTKRRFDEAVARRERELGRSLSYEERGEIKETMRTSSSAHKQGPYFNYPLMRIVAEILLLTVPAIILLGFVATLGAFLIGLVVAGLLVELTRRTLPHL